MTRNEAEEAIKHIEGELQVLRKKQQAMAAGMGKDALEEAEQLRERQQSQATQLYEKMFQGPKENKNALIIEAYENVLTQKRLRE